MTIGYWGSHNELEDVLELARAGKLQSTVVPHGLGDAEQALRDLAAG